ncbi:MAG: GNAT family N-acetyltransferase [Pseudomonadota bacterium]
MLKPTDEICFTVECSEKLEPLEAVWRVMEAAQEISIHQTYDWCRAWTEANGQKPLLITAAYASGPKSGETAFILPLALRKYGPLKVASYIGATHNNANFGVFSADFLEDATLDIIRDIGAQIAELPLGVDFVYLDRQPEARAEQKHPFLQWPSVENHNLSFQVTLKDGFEAVLSRVNAKRRRKKFRVSERRLEELGGYEFICAKSADEAHDLLDAFFRQKAERFEFQGLPDAFKEDRVKAVFHRLAEESLNQQRKMIELYAIRLKRPDGFICAIAAISRKGGEIICQFSSIAMGETEQCSPGELLFYLLIKDCCDKEAQVFDFGVGDEQYKRSWCDKQTAHYDTMIAVTAAGKVGMFIARLTTGIKRFVKRRPVFFRSAKALRLWLAPAQR